jgi:putative transposase
MARKKYKMEEIIQHLRTVEIEVAKGTSVEEAVRKIAVPIQSYYRWKKEYSGMDLSQAKRLKELEQETARLRKIVSDQALDILILKEVSSGNF